VNSLPKTVTRQRRDCDLNPDFSAPESSTLTTRLPSHLQVSTNKWQVAGVYLPLIAFFNLTVQDGKRSVTFCLCLPSRFAVLIAKCLRSLLFWTQSIIYYYAEAARTCHATIGLHYTTAIQR